MILSFRTDRPGQTVQTQINSMIRVYTVCHSICIVWTHYSMVEPHSSNLRVITTNFLGVRIFRKFTVQTVADCFGFLYRIAPHNESNGPGHAKTYFMTYANNKGADQPAHPHSLISTFVVRCFDSMICNTCFIQSLKFLAGLCS